MLHSRQGYSAFPGFRLQLHAPVFPVFYPRTAYDDMAADIVMRCIVRLRRMFRFRWGLTALFLPLTGRFLLLGCQLQLYLAVEGGKFGFQSFQLVLLLPCLARYTRNCGISCSSASFFALYWSMTEGIFSSAFRKFMAAAWVSAIARCPLL